MRLNPFLFQVSYFMPDASSLSASTWDGLNPFLFQVSYFEGEKQMAMDTILPVVLIPFCFRSLISGCSTCTGTYTRQETRLNPFLFQVSYFIVKAGFDTVGGFERLNPFLFQVSYFCYEFFYNRIGYCRVLIPFCFRSLISRCPF